MANILLDHLERFVAFQTTADKPEEKRACLTWISDTWLKASCGESLEGEVENAPYFYLRCPDAKLLWFAHVDVVPAADEQFTLRIEDEKAYGRGVKDMKGGALAFLVAYRDACLRGEAPAISILLTSDEEIAGSTVSTLLDERVVSGPIAFTPDSGSKDQIVVEQKGMVWARLFADGQGGHGASPWDADNPNRTLVEAIRRLHDAFPPGKGNDWQMTVEVTKFLGTGDDDRIDSQISSHAGCCLDIRFPPNVAVNEALARVTSLLPEACRLDIQRRGSPVQTSPDLPLVRRVHEIAREVTGSEIPIGREHGTSDARFLAEHGIPAVIYGPVGGGLHSDDEWISISSLEQHVEINRRLIEALKSL